jgi:hypothetical protein
MAGGGSGSTQQSTQTTSQKLPQWEQPYAKEYLASLASQIFPGLTLPADYLGKGKDIPNFGSGQASSGQASSGQASGAGGQASGSAAAPQGNGVAELQGSLNPLAQQFLGSAIGGSSYLQGQAQNNPAAIYGASSPDALNQLSQLYGNLPQASSGSGAAPAKAKAKS